MSDIGRNEPCPCGSGKKHKKCCIGKLPREQYIYIGHNEKFEGLSFENGQAILKFPDGKKEKAESTFSQIQYTRKSGKVNVVNLIPDAAIFDMLLHLASKFDVILAIDTNTKQIGEDDISVACFFECTLSKKSVSQLEASFRNKRNFAFRNCPRDKAEKYSLGKLVNLITNSPKYNEKIKIALITDHDIDNHSKFMSRELPVWGEIYLPDNITLMYASSDTGKENLLNLLISTCDMDANEVLKNIKENQGLLVDGSKILIENIPSFKE